MPLDPRVRRFLDLLAATNPASASDQSVDERRAGLVQLMRFGGSPDPVERVEDRSFDGPSGKLRVRLYAPAGSDRARYAIIYLHGGGLVAGSVETHDPIARSLARVAGCLVLSVDYRLAPEHRFPAALEDAEAAVRQIHERAHELGFEAGRLAVAGDSAGATLAAVVCQRLGPGQSSVALQILLCPILDYAGRSESRASYASGYLVDEGTLAHDLSCYLVPGVDSADPRVSPLRAASLRGSPPAIIHTAEFDPLRDEGKSYADRLAAEGISVSYTCHPGMVHLFYGLGEVIPQARAAFDQLGEQIRAALDYDA
jgi:acetyl esterase